MSQNARRVLTDCKLAARELESAEADPDLARIRWVTCLALLRAVGHVLRKIDAEALGRVPLAEELFEKWQQEEMFQKFIEQERNEILKEYLHRIEVVEKGEKVFLDIGGGHKLLLEEGGGALLVQDTWREIAKASGYKSKSGASPVEIVNMAIHWWEEKLAEYDAASKL